MDQQELSTPSWLRYRYYTVKSFNKIMISDVIICLTNDVHLVVEAIFYVA